MQRKKHKRTHDHTKSHAFSTDLDGEMAKSTACAGNHDRVALPSVSEAQTFIAGVVQVERHSSSSRHTLLLHHKATVQRDHWAGHLELESRNELVLERTWRMSTKRSWSSLGIVSTSMTYCWNVPGV